MAHLLKTHEGPEGPARSMISSFRNPEGTDTRHGYPKYMVLRNQTVARSTLPLHLDPWTFA